MTPMEKIVASMRVTAQSSRYSPLVKERVDMHYFKRCTRLHKNAALIFTRETGRYAGELLNCFDLALSFIYGETGLGQPFDLVRARTWARMFFGSNTRHLWIEPPANPSGQARYRLFCDDHWNPIRTQQHAERFAALGWKSFNQFHGDRTELVADQGA